MDAAVPETSRKRTASAAQSSSSSDRATRPRLVIPQCASITLDDDGNIVSDDDDCRAISSPPPSSCADLTQDSPRLEEESPEGTTIAILHLSMPLNCVYIPYASLSRDLLAQQLYKTILNARAPVRDGVELRLLLQYARDRENNRLFFMRHEVEEFYNNVVLGEPKDQAQLADRYELSSFCSVEQMQGLTFTWCLRQWLNGLYLFPPLFPAVSQIATQYGPLHSSFNVRRVIVFNPDADDYNDGRLLEPEMFDQSATFSEDTVPRLSGPAANTCVMVLYPWRITRQAPELKHESGGVRVYYGRDVPAECAAMWEFLCSPEAHHHEKQRQLHAALSCCTFLAEPFAEADSDVADAFDDTLSQHFASITPNYKQLPVEEYARQLTAWCDAHHFSGDATLLDGLWKYKKFRLAANPLDTYMSMQAFCGDSTTIGDSGLIPTVKNVFVSDHSDVFVPM